MLKPLLSTLLLLILSLSSISQIWNRAGSGFNNHVSKLYVFNNELYAGGSFTQSGSNAIKNIAKWDGNDWVALPIDLDSNVNAIAEYKGELCVGGNFTSAGSVSLNHIAKWNGSNWLSLDTGLNGNVLCLAVYNGNLYAGGSFTLSGDAEVNHIARWNDTAWSPVSIGFDSTVNTLVVIDNQLYAGGSFTSADGNKVNGIAKWDGNEWSSIGNGMNGTVNDIKQFSNDIYAAGSFTTAEDTLVNYITKWDGTNWLPVSNGADSIVYNLEIYNNNLYAIGAFTTIGGINANKIAKYNGEKWENEGAGIEGGLPYCFKTFNEELFVGGNFTNVNNISSSSVARLGPCPNLGFDKNKTIICRNDVTDISALYNTAGLSVEWDVPNPEMASFGNHKLIVTNTYGCKDSALITVDTKIKTWVGKNSDNWHDTLNWSNNILPDDNTHVIVNTNSIYPSIISEDNVSVASLDVTNGANVEIKNNKQLTLKSACDSLQSPRIELLPNVVIVDSALATSIQSVDSSTVVFSGSNLLLQRFTTGSVIVSGITPATPYGFMRKITGIQINDTTYSCTTVNAALTDVFKELHLRYAKTFSAADSFARTASGLLFNVNMPDIILYDVDGNNSTTYDQIKITGNLEVTPDFIFDVDISPFPVRLTYAKIGGGFTSDLTLSVTAGGSVNIVNKEIPIFEHLLTPITIHIPLPLPPFDIPIVVFPYFKVYLGAKASINAQISASQVNSLSMSSFLEYQNNDWHTGSTKNMQTQYTFPGIDGSASAKVYVKPAMEFKLYNMDAIKSLVYSDFYLKAEGQIYPSRSCSLKAGIDAGAEANIEFLGFTLASVSYPNIFDISTTLHTCSFTNKPTVSTASISNVGITSALAGGNVTNDNGASVTSRGICWSSISQYPSLSNNVILSGTGIGSFNIPISSLQSNTAYRVRAFATNSEGTSYGNTVSFTTHQSASLPTLSTKSITAISQNSAQTGGIITSPGNTAVTSRGVCWSTSSNPTTSNNVVYQGNGSGNYVSSLTGLSANTTYYVRAFAINSFGTAYGNEQFFTTIGGGSSNTVTDIDGNVYRTITIGSQIWMAENLRTTRYQNGDYIPTELNVAAWNSTTNGAYAIYDNSMVNETVYGKLYNGHAVLDSRKICPNGWHIPDSTEFLNLANYLGGRSLAGGKMKEAGLEHWMSPNTDATNTSGFTSLPQGIRHDNGYYYSIGIIGNYWSSSVLSNFPNYLWFINTQYNHAFMSIGGSLKNTGLSCRCIKN